MNNASKDGFVDFGLVHCSPRAAEKSAKWVQSGDVIFNNTNSTELVGKSCLFRGWEGRCAFSNHSTRLRCHSEMLTPEWLHYCLRDLWLTLTSKKKPVAALGVAQK
jgi:type I restriction enzyme S subunit